jgi:predicted transposase YbfD/YdcC
LELRSLKVAVPPPCFEDWPGIAQVLEVTRKRQSKKGQSTEIAYAITSLPAEKVSPERLLETVRSHWAIENNLHRTRDMAFDEDRSTLRKQSAPQAMAALRNTAIHLAKRIKKNMRSLTLTGSRFPRQIIKIIREN